jgi:hypothetical protein
LFTPAWNSLGNGFNDFEFSDQTGLKQLVCQRNSLNLCGFSVQEIAELSEILTVQKKAP